MADSSARVSRRARGARDSSRASRGRRRRAERPQSQRGHVFDRRLAAIAVAATVALLAIARGFVDRMGPTGWSWPVLTLCVVVSAGAARGLLGLRNVSEEDERRPPTRFAVAGWLVLLGAATLPNLHGLHIGFLADDFGLLSAAELADGPLDAVPTAPSMVFLRPVAQLLWWVGLHLWGGAPLGYHVLSVLLHAGNTALVYSLARRYTESMYGGAMAALLFAVHPVHVEATVWPAAQADLLCAGFCLSSMWCLEQCITAADGRRKHLALAGALAAFLLALLSKEVAVALPGVVFLRLVLAPGGRRWARAVGVSVAYALVVAAYLGVCFSVLGKYWIGGSGWSGPFPAAPLLVASEFFFPVHRDLFDSLLPLYLRLGALAVMAAGLIWWIRNLEFVNCKRLILYAGYLFVLTVPIWAAGIEIGADMANSRYAYLPTVGLALLFGEICARRSADRRQVSLASVATVLVAAMLSIWYVVPWRQAALLRNDLVVAGVRVVARLPDSPPPSGVFFTGVPFFHALGAPVFVEGGYGMALSRVLGKQVSVRAIEPTSTAFDMMSASDLLPGEYLVSWDSESLSMVVERTGARPAPEPVAGGLP
jgi:hypothetical protein